MNKQSSLYRGRWVAIVCVLVLVFLGTIISTPYVVEAKANACMSSLLIVPMPDDCLILFNSSEVIHTIN